jgi:hypothetical protein
LLAWHASEADTLTLLSNTAPIVRRLLEVSGLTDTGSREQAIQAARRAQRSSGDKARRSHPVGV